MTLKIIESYTSCGVNVGKIVKRIIRYLPPNILEGINTIKVLDIHPSHRGFAKYNKQEGQIEIYVQEIVSWQPWLLKKSYVFPYLSIGLALGHEIDHHVNRYNHSIDLEHSAETNALKYVYPSLGIFKPIPKLISFLARIASKQKAISGQ